MDLAFQYAEKHALETEGQYPYTAKNGACKDDGEGLVKSRGYHEVRANKPESLLRALENGPVSIAIQADQPVFRSYASGILNSAKCGTKLDHGVLIVGHGNDGSQDYWIVKNSWGTTWGEKGYIKIADVAGNGICGVNMEPV
jgi:Papain family cysteine protease